jgi:hypothetical protein
VRRSLPHTSQKTDLPSACQANFAAEASSLGFVILRNLRSHATGAVSAELAYDRSTPGAIGAEGTRSYANAPLGLPSRTIFWQYA